MFNSRVASPFSKKDHFCSVVGRGVHSQCVVNIVSIRVVRVCVCERGGGVWQAEGVGTISFFFFS